MISDLQNFFSLLILLLFDPRFHIFLIMWNHIEYVLRQSFLFVALGIAIFLLFSSVVDSQSMQNIAINIDLFRGKHLLIGLLTNYSWKNYFRYYRFEKLDLYLFVIVHENLWKTVFAVFSKAWVDCE